MALSHPLAIPFLVCHFLREAVLPTNILKWLIKREAFINIDIEKEMDPPLDALSFWNACLDLPKIFHCKSWSSTTIIAETLLLDLVLVTFSRNSFSLSSCCLLQWIRLFIVHDSYMNFLCLRSFSYQPMHNVYYNSYNKNFVQTTWYWKVGINFSSSSCSSLIIGADLNDVPKHQSTSLNFDAKELLLTFNTKYNDLLETFEYSKDMPNYLQYFKDIFEGLLY